MKTICVECNKRITKVGNNIRCKACAGVRRREKCKGYDDSRRARKRLRKTLSAFGKNLAVLSHGRRFTLVDCADYMDLIS